MILKRLISACYRLFQDEIFFTFNLSYHEVILLLVFSVHFPTFNDFNFTFNDVVCGISNIEVFYRDYF